MKRSALYFVCILFIAHLKLAHLQASTSDFIKCPRAEKIRPCECYHAQQGSIVNCHGVQVTQALLVHLFQKLRKVNSLTSDDPLKFHRLAVRDTALTTLDLTPFVGVHLKELYIFWNLNLTSIVGPSVMAGNDLDQSNSSTFPLYEGSIHVDTLVIEKNKMTDLGLGDSLKFFHPKMTSLSISSTKIQGSNPRSESRSTAENLELLPGLSAFTQLTYLHLGDNKLTHFGGGQLRKNSKLEYLYLGGNNFDQKLSLQDDAFIFDDPSNDYNCAHLALTIDLGSTGLTTSHFEGINKTGLVTTGQRPIILNLFRNKLDALPEPIFRPFLLAHRSNKLKLRGNPLRCNGKRIKWIKDDWKTFEHRVQQAECFDDPGNTVFTSNLVC